MKEIRIGIIGFGTVGAGVVECLQNNGDLVRRRAGLRPVIQRIADLDVTTDRGVSVPDNTLTTDAASVLSADDIDVVVELVGGTGVAKDCVMQALRNGKPVVTANKALLAAHGEEIFAAAESSSADVFYEASVGGGIPIIKAMREGLIANNFIEIVGILNGTCNYILTKMEKDGTSFEEVLYAAQAAGYAEADPGIDIDGHDAAHKATILASLAYGEWFGLDPVYIEGIRGIKLQDLRNAARLGYRIKLLAIIKQQNNDVQMRVHPALINDSSLLAHVDDVYNAVWVEGDTVGGTMYYGQGAGRKPTASAVVADIVDVALNLKLGSHGRIPGFRPHQGYANILPAAEVESRYYLRLKVKNAPGVLASISSALGQKQISIASLTQEEAASASATLIILTHTAREGNMQHALEALHKLDEVEEKPVMLRIEDLAADPTGREK